MSKLCFSSSVTKLQKDFETFFDVMENQSDLYKCDYLKHTKFYQDSKVKVSIIAVKAKAIPKNYITIKQVGLLKDSINNLERLHKLGRFSSGQVESLRISFDSIMTSIVHSRR